MENGSLVFVLFVYLLDGNNVHIFTPDIYQKYSCKNIDVYTEFL